VGEHPLDAGRIEKTEKEIQAILAPRPDYLVSSSEYREIHERVIVLEDRPETLAPPSSKDNPTPKIQRKDVVE